MVVANAVFGSTSANADEGFGRFLPLDCCSTGELVEEGEEGSGDLDGVKSLSMIWWNLFSESCAIVYFSSEIV